MSTYRIVCTDQEPASQPPQHAHIVAVGVGDDPERATQRLTLAEVLQMMERGDNFFTKGVQSGKIALVDKYWCQHCRQYHIRSAADAVKDNNLDSLRYCNWSK
jgi:hypothetical protein